MKFRIVCLTLLSIIACPLCVRNGACLARTLLKRWILVTRRSSSWSAGSIIPASNSLCVSSPFTSDVPRQMIAPTAQPIDLFGLGVYYGLFFLTVVLIVTTLPKAIIAWKERG